MKRTIGYAIALLSLVSSSVQALTLQDRINAAKATADGSSAAQECLAIQPFYWEVGEKTGMDYGASSPFGDTTFRADTHMNIASASKWIYAAYVTERYAGALSAYDIQFLTLESGYHWMDPNSCLQNGVDTVNHCLAFYNPPGPNPTDGHHNGDRDDTLVNWFAYNGGHDEAHAAHLPGIATASGSVINLGLDDDGALMSAINSELGFQLVLSYIQPSLPGGVRTTPALYAQFLRAIMNGNLWMNKFLGSFRVCTNPNTCPNAYNTPVQNNESWHYSIGHWIEDDTTFPYDDKSFSNSGSLGFYAWIDSTKNTWYGIIGRDGSQTGDQPDDDNTMGWSSVECGRRIRKAWFTGVVQP